MTAESHRRDGPAQWDGLRRVRRSRGLVVPPAPLYAVRAHRLLRLLAGAARQRARGGHRAPADQELRAGRVMVLELRGGPDVLKRPGAGPAGAPSRRPAGAGPGGPGAQGLAVAPALTRGQGTLAPRNLRISRCLRPGRPGSPRINGHMCGDLRGARGGAPRGRPVAGPVPCPPSYKARQAGYVLAWGECDE